MFVLVMIIRLGLFKKLKMVLKMFESEVGDAFVWSLLQNFQTLLFVCLGFEERI